MSHFAHRPHRVISRVFPAVVISLVAAVMVMTATAPSRAQSIGGVTGTKENLDLPFDAVGDTGPDDDPPEIIDILGRRLEGDAFFFVIDRSSSMHGEPLALAKREIARNIRELPATTEFGIVFFDSGVDKFPRGARPARATPAMKAAALSWLSGVPGGHGSCCRRALLEALRFANLSTSGRSAILYVGDGGGTCPGNGGEPAYLDETLGRVRSMNRRNARIDTIGVRMAGRTTQEIFLRRLASQNSGHYSTIH